ncbi:unnamed protein product [Allacma fusca]|uniref:Major facilitator superfamily (MFS) profile domain-containing protein n=1 Tax=Allacma fusca TaxID=39272 RepID=A0A8J2PU03_9HEXA|nr:unnamed protein product [Allacma fusca]
MEKEFKDQKFELLEKKKKFKDFDDILEIVGGNGKYQKIILFGVVTPLIIICPLFVMNRIFIMSVPDHWCHVPGKPNETSTEEWKNMTIPKIQGNTGSLRYSQCEMFGENGTQVKCSQWEYDKTNYENTLPSEFNWVCENEHYTADVFSIYGFGNVAGAIVFGIAADKYGRKPLFFVSIFIFFLFTMIGFFTPQNISAFLTLQFLAGLAFPFLFSSPCTIAAEVSGKDYRAWIYSVVWMVWVIGNSILPLIAYVLRSWFVIGIVTTIPSLLLFFYFKILQESPRWLISVGRTKEAGKIIQKIARVNGRFITPEDLADALQALTEKEAEQPKKTSVGIWTLFMKKRLALNTILLCLAWSVNGLIYYGLTLNTTSMSGNEFFNYFILSTIELPAGWLAGVLVNKSGRRWTQAAFFVISALSFFVASWFVFDPKFAVAITSLVCYLQGTEIFPTNLRSTGSGLASTVCSIIGTCGPYIIFLGRFHAAIPYIVLTGLALVGTLSSACLPETLNQSLPETVEDANKFGKNHKFWSYLPEDMSNKPRAEKK